MIWGGGGKHDHACVSNLRVANVKIVPVYLIELDLHFGFNIS